MRERNEPAIAAQWARARLRDLEDAYAAGDRGLEQRIVTTSLRYGVLCRFTAFVAVDSRVVNEGGEIRRVTQPVELPSGWEPPADVMAPAMLKMSSVAPVPPPPAAPGHFAPAQAEATAAAPRMPMGFAAMPASLRSRRAVAFDRALTVEDVRALAATEAQRLREAAEAPVWERRDLLDDLASRLHMLVDSLTDAAFQPLRDLVAVLRGDTPVDERWAAALDALTRFAGDAAKPDGTTPAATTSTRQPPPTRKAFWKR